MDYQQRVDDFYDKKADYYANNSASLLLERLTYFTKLLPEKGRILDIGCGVGQDTEYLTKKGFKTIGIDSSCGMLEYAEKNRTCGKFIKMNMLDIRKNFKDNSFDGIWASSSLTHIPKCHFGIMLSRIKKIIKKGHPIILILKKRTERIEPKRKFPFNKFYKKEIQEFSRKSKLKIIQIIPFKTIGIEWFFIHMEK